MPSKNPPTNIRDLREHKNLSQDKVAAAAGVTYSQFVRIEEGSGKTTPEEVAHVLAVLEGMESGTRKLAGRPFNDPEKQAAVQAAREAGKSVAAAMGLNIIEPAEPLEDMTVKQLRQKAKEEDVEVSSRASKAELIEALSEETDAPRKQSDLAKALRKSRKS